MIAVRGLRLLPWSICGGALASLAVIALQYVSQGSSPTLLVRRPVLFGGVTALAIAAALVGVVFRTWSLESWPLLNGEKAAAIGAFLAGLNVAGLLLVVPIALLVWRFHADVVGGWTYPLVNKRWVVALYYLGIFAVLVAPVLAARLSGMRTAAAATVSSIRWRPVADTAALASLLLVVWFFAGPPWHMAEHHRPIDFHEQVHLGPLQAIDEGYLPFIGPASTQYGPGSQLAAYWLMKSQPRFDVVGFRVAQAILQLIAAIVVAILAYALCGWWRAVAILLLGFAYSPLRFLYPLADGTFGGDYGWGNAWRYLGAMVVVPLMAHVVISRKPPVRLAAGALGIACGAFSWMAQENLTSTLIAMAITLTILAASNDALFARVRQAAVAMAVGLIGSWAAVLAFYAWHGEAGRYLDNYFAVAGAVAMGFQNTWWNEAGSLGVAYYLTPVLVGIVALHTIWEVPSLQLRRQWSSRHVTTLAMAAVVLASYQTVLYRSDAAHLMNTLIALPFVVVLALVDMPGWNQQSLRSRWTVRFATAAIVLLVWPFGSTLLAHPIDTYVRSSARFRRADTAVVPSGSEGIAFARATLPLSDEPGVIAGGPPMRQFLEFAEELHQEIGRRPVYFADTIYVYSSLYYFIADLRPAPFLGDPEIMIINSDRRRAALDHMQRHIAGFGAMVTSRIDGDEARLFLNAYPTARVIKRSWLDRPVFILLAAEQPL